MFEKDAEEYAEKKICQEYNDDCMGFDKCKEYCERYHNTQKYWKDGAEFGYNKAKEDADKMKSQFLELCNLKDMRIAELEKANEWYYPSKGEYPKECENVWCYCKGIGIKFCCVGHTIVGGDNKVRWWANNKTEELRVIAWKEIVPSEYTKEEEE